MKMERQLLVFCLEYDQNSILVSHAYFWIRELSKYFDKTTVVCVRAASSKSVEHFEIMEIGGGSLWNRVRALLRLTIVSMRIFSRRKNLVIFHHMLIQPLAIFGWFYRILGVPQLLWYSHSTKSLTLRIGARFCNSIVSPNRDCFPIKNCRKVIEVGHGIQVEPFERVWDNPHRSRSIAVLGRVSRIKNIHVIVKAVSRFQKKNNRRIMIDVIGPILDDTYCKYLEELAKDEKVAIRFMPAQHASDVPKLLCGYRYVFNGNPGTLDKSAVEAVLAGCILITEVGPALELTGMYKVWSDLNYINPSLDKQISIAETLSEEKIAQIRKELFQSARRNNELKGTINRIATVIQRVKA
jgi:glycosyltransferase involved in cell wall biosynthesis